MNYFGMPLICNFSVLNPLYMCIVFYVCRLVNSLERWFNWDDCSGGSGRGAYNSSYRR